MTKTQYLIFLCGMANFINAADRVIMPIAIVPMSDLYDWDLKLQGWILSAFAYGYISSQVRELLCFNATVLMLYQIGMLTSFHKSRLRARDISWPGITTKTASLMSVR